MTFDYAAIWFVYAIHWAQHPFSAPEGGIPEECPTCVIAASALKHHKLTNPLYTNLRLYQPLSDTPVAFC